MFCTMVNTVNSLHCNVLIVMILLLFIKGHQGFFIKHSSGLCLQPNSEPYAKGNDKGAMSGQWGPVYFVLFQNTCLHPDAQFRFYKKFDVLYNIGKNGTFLTRPPSDGSGHQGGKYQIYHSPHSLSKTTFIYSPRFIMKQTSSGSLKLINSVPPYCATPETIPVKGSAVIQNTSCTDEAEQKFTFEVLKQRSTGNICRKMADGWHQMPIADDTIDTDIWLPGSYHFVFGPGSVTDESKNMTYVNCPSTQVMKVVNAEYGEFNNEIFDYDKHANCSLPSTCIVKEQCDNQISCNMNVKSSLFKHVPCPGKVKKLYMEYMCVDSLTTPITKVDDVRLSSEGSANQGFVEVYENSVWKKIADENMEIRKARDLCKYLGFSDHDGKVVSKNVKSSYKILSGDLSCRENSCCVYLYSSTPAEEPTLPFVSCKICSKELKLNDSIFKTSSSNGREARIANSGWCFSKSNTQYLQIDLVLDYVITQIATFGNRNGTQWMRSYILKYSRDKSKLDSDGITKSLKANINGFDVAFQNLSKVYARYLKIIPEGEAGCMRIEVCGYELIPGPPEKKPIVQIKSRSVNISWGAPVIKGEGPIFYIITEKNTLFSEIKQTQLEKNLTGLKPYTSYVVKVSSTNSFGKNENAFVNLSFNTTEAAPDGPPIDVVFDLRSKTSLTVSWNAPEKIFWNGNLKKYKVCYSTAPNAESCFEETSKTYTNNSLLPATKYSVKVAASTSAGFGVFSVPISKITNQEPIVLNQNTSFSLRVRLEKPKSYIKSISVIVQAAQHSTKLSDSYQSNELNPYSSASSKPYITAAFTNDELPIDFIIGDGQPYKFDGTSYVNQRLKENADYIVFVRFIETEDSYYSTEWSNSVKTYARPQAPGGLTAVSLPHRSLNISWEIPEYTQPKAELNAITVCYKEHNNGNRICSERQPSSSSFMADSLKSFTMYDIFIYSNTSIGNSLYNNISKITNEKRMEVSQQTNTGFFIKLPKIGKTVETVYIIVKHGDESSKLPDQYRLKDLEPFNKQSPSKPYITAKLTKFTTFPQIFEVGNNSKDNNYHNKPLKQNNTYFVFARILIDNNLYYSTDWTNPIIISTLPPAPEIEIVSYGEKATFYISWKQPDLPVGQKVVDHIITYYWKVENKKEITTNSASKFYILRGLEYEKKYFIIVKTKSDTKTSKASKVKSKTTNSERLPVEASSDNNYVISLRKPKNDIEEVKLIILRLKSNTTKPTPSEKTKLSNSPSTNNDKDIAFVADSYNMGDFKDGKLDVILQLKDEDKERRRRASEPLKMFQRNYTYRLSQWNYEPLGNYSTSYWSDPIFIKPKVKEDNNGGSERTGDGNSGVVIGVTVPLVIILVLLVVGLIFWRSRRRNDNAANVVYEKDGQEVVSFANRLDNNDGEDEAQVDEAADEQIYSNQTGVLSKDAHQPIPISEFAHYVNEMKANDESAFKKDYNALPTTCDVSHDVAKKPDNKKRNRYGNIVTYDHSRVVLSGGEDEDYINASFIDGIKQNSYIACQGPTKVTLGDMWRMVWEQNSYSIIMVTSLTELGKPKCEKYWPDEGSEMFDKIQVTLVKTEEFAYYVTHTLQIKKGEEEREVKHYYFSSWPDHGVPKYPTQLLAFRKHMRVNHFQQSGPIIVHCSAGVGRTGVFLAIDMSLRKLEKGVTDKVDVFGQVLEMRGRRMNMIQTLEQYIFVHDAILETILCGINEVNSSNIKQEMKKLTEVQAGGMTGFQEKFKRLGDVSPEFSDEECTAGLMAENCKKNRSKSIYPAESNRAGLQYIHGVENSDYINAVFVHGYLGKNYFIATQSPLPNTVNDFWRMVNEQKSSAIVLLNNVKDGTSFPKFWPSARAQPKQYGTLTIQLDSSTDKDGISTRKFILSPYPDLQDGRVVNIFHYTKWLDHRAPESADVLLKLMPLVEKARQNSGKAPVIVACSNGAGRTGTYIAISNLLERMKVEQAVDVFQAIKMIRSSRPQFVENAEQFKFCYEVVSSYLDSFGDYANFE